MVMSVLSPFLHGFCESDQQGLHNKPFYPLSQIASLLIYFFFVLFCQFFIYSLIFHPICSFPSLRSSQYHPTMYLLIPPDPLSILSPPLRKDQAFQEHQPNTA